ncbi:jg18535 [Pararge aegeria aegeria]|uniref:Jg18535 protein n=1 Tax=Pararge aegeria aegeria TaxID=348720 RepID=A0A8S4S3A3_9NEOP|nr:jg18535 [Pararge aegeria aegeria]
MWRSVDQATRVTDIAQRVAKLKWQWGTRFGGEMDVGVPRVVNAALVDPRRGGRTTLGASQVAAGFKLHKTLEFGTPYERPMSSSGRLSVDMMMMTYKMKNNMRFPHVVFHVLK